MELNNFNKDNYPPLNLPPAELRFQREGHLIKVFDPLRKKFVNFTPEEYVRQHFVNYLINELHYPASITANEVGIDLNGTRKRCDTVIFDRQAKPMIIVEYKAPGISITQSVFDQIVRYNMKLRAKYLIVSNGINHYCCIIDYPSNSYNFIPRIPDYRELLFPTSEN